MQLGSLSGQNRLKTFITQTLRQGNTARWLTDRPWIRPMQAWSTVSPIRCRTIARLGARIDRFQKASANAQSCVYVLSPRQRGPHPGACSAASTFARSKISYEIWGYSWISTCENRSWVVSHSTSASTSTGRSRNPPAERL